MLSPRRPHAFRTILIVFVAAICFWAFRSHRTFTKVAALPESVSSITGATKMDPGAVQSAASNQRFDPEAASELADLSKFTFSTLWGQEKDRSLGAFSKWAARYTNA